MKKLETSNYYKAQTPLDKATINTMFAQAVIDRKVDGEIYVDNCTNPEVFYIAHPYGMSFLFGKQNDDNFNNQLRDYLINKNHVRRCTEWLQAFPHSWNKKIDILLKLNLTKNPDSKNQTSLTFENESKVVEIKRLNFNFRLDSYNESKKQFNNHEYKIVRTTEEIYETFEGSVVPKNFWKNAKQFYENGMGYSVVVDNNPVATAFSAFINESQLELGIETLAEFRGNSFALYACSALIDYCVENNLEPIWSCSSINIGSYRLAAKLGFAQSYTLPYYILPYKTTI